MCAFSWFENACCCLRVVFAILKNSLEAPTFSAGVLLLNDSHSSSIFVVYLTVDTIRKFSCSLAIHVRFSFLSAKIINLDAKCKCFGVYFLCLRIFFWGSANLFFESANQADEGKECRVCARFVGTAPFVIKREC